MSSRRSAVASDLPALVALDADIFGADAWSERSWAGELAQVPDSRQVELVLDENAQVLAYVVVMVVAEVADLQRIAVRPDTRRSGIARELLTTAIQVAAARGCERMLLEVAADNPAALALYAGAGFRPVHRRAGYYGAGRDALIMLRDLR